jgi:hypothetical protein
MKIILSKDESYSINVPEEMDSRKFQAFVSRMQEILKLFKRDVLFDAIDSTLDKPEDTEEKKPKQTRQRINLSREGAVELSKAYYSTDKKNALKSFCSNYNVPFNYITLKRYVATLRIKYNIPASEVGLIRFPRQGESYSLDKLRIPKEINSEPIQDMR